MNAPLKYKTLWPDAALREPTDKIRLTKWTQSPLSFIVFIISINNKTVTKHVLFPISLSLENKTKY